MVDPMPTPINSIHFNHNGSMLLAGGADGMIRIFDILSSCVVAVVVRLALVLCGVRAWACFIRVCVCVTP